MKQALLDTNILSYFLRGNPTVIEQFRIYRQQYTYISFSIFTYYEIKSGLLYKDARNQQQQFERLADSQKNKTNVQVTDVIFIEDKKEDETL